MDLNNVVHFIPLMAVAFIVSICALYFALRAFSVIKAIMPLVHKKEAVLAGLVNGLKKDSYASGDIDPVTSFLATAVKLRITSWEKLELNERDLKNYIERGIVLKAARLLPGFENEKTIKRVRQRIDSAIRSGIVTVDEVYS